jgi:hypothetical protein
MMDVEKGHSMETKGVNQPHYSLSSPLAAHPVVVEKEAQRRAQQVVVDAWDKVYNAEEEHIGAQAVPIERKTRTFDPILPSIVVQEEESHTSWLHENDSENGDAVDQIEVHSPTPLRPKPEIIREIRGKQLRDDRR